MLSHGLSDRESKCRLCMYSIGASVKPHNINVANNHCLKFTHGKHKPKGAYKSDDKFECPEFREKGNG